MAEKLSIVIKSEQVAENGQSVTETESEKKSSSTKSNNISTLVQSVYVNQLVNASLATIKQCFNYQVSIYGSTTGDYITQSKIDNTFQTVNNILGVAGGIVGGFAMGGPIGGAVGAVVSIGNIAINTALNYNTYKLNIGKENAAASFNSAQIGSILVNGNR